MMGSYFPVNLAILRRIDTTWKMQANILPLFINKKNRKNMSDSPKKMHSIFFPMAKKYFRGNESDSSQYLWLNGCSSSQS